jgi:allophanate hydrolase subunit 1
MVRHKVRYLLVQFDFEPQLVLEVPTNETLSLQKRIDSITRSDINQALREMISSLFGLTSTLVAYDLQGESSSNFV